MAGAAAGDEALVRAFQAFAREHTAEPLYTRLAQQMAGQPALAALLQAAPPTQRKPVLLFAALHERLLALAEAGAPLPPLAAYFASLGGARAPDAALPDALQAFLHAEAQALRETIASRATQTNEVGRCAVLWPALAAIAQAHGGRPLALFDFGCSAGLNLSVDAMRIRYTGADGDTRAAVGPDTPDAPRLACRLLDDAVPPLSPWHLAARLGVDPQPVDLDDRRAVRWLRACLWPGERERASRFDAALARARADRHPVRQSDDGLAALHAWLDGLAPEWVPVLFHSWVAFYFDAAQLAAHAQRARALVRERGLVWLSAEDAASTHALTGLALPERPTGAAGTPTWWVCTLRGAPGPAEPQARLLGCSHPHGSWLAWQG